MSPRQIAETLPLPEPEYLDARYPPDDPARWYDEHTKLIEPDPELEGIEGLDGEDAEGEDEEEE